MGRNINRDISSAINRSTYSMTAIGCRDVRVDELTLIIELIREASSENISTLKDRIDILYKYNPSTIELAKRYQQQSCPEYIDGLYDCFMPDVTSCRATRERIKRLKENDYRGTPEYKEWRGSVFKRDGYTCRECGVTGGTLNAHHIKKFKDFPDDRYLVENGLTLCVPCHRLKHRKNNK